MAELPLSKLQRDFVRRFFFEADLDNFLLPRCRLLGNAPQWNETAFGQFTLLQNRCSASKAHNTITKKILQPNTNPIC